MLVLWTACTNPDQTSSKIVKDCEYIKDYIDLGNTKMDTIRLGKRLLDPIDDFTNFEETDFGFVKRENQLYRKAKTHRNCGEQFIDVEYYQDFTNRIELASFRAYDDRYFTTKGRVNFWWVNSDGHLIVPINKATPETFKPFENICGGTDHKAVYYGCPNRGVYQLEIPINSAFEFIAKKDNYWNSPSHYVIVDQKVFDIKYELKKGYFCILDKSISIGELKKWKPKSD